MFSGGSITLVSGGIRTWVFQDFSPELVSKWQRLLQEREDKIGAKFKAANAHSETICSKVKTKK